MKKVLILAVLCAVAQMSSAAYLYWQVSAADISGASGATSWYGSDVNAAKIYSKSDGGDWSAQTILLDGSSIGSVAPVPTGSMYAIDVSDDANTYSYYVELGRYENSAFNAIASSAAETHADLYAAGSIVSSLPDVANISVWHAGSFSAVPEPTSGLLMLIGAAMLGLKRKNRSLA